MKLPAETKTLCARIAMERTRPAQLQTALELRKDAARVLASGEPVEGVHGWLRGLLAEAMAHQATGVRPKSPASKVRKPQVYPRAENIPPFESIQNQQMTDPA